MRVIIRGLNKSIVHEWMHEPSSGWKWNTSGGVEDHVPRAKVVKGLVESGRVWPAHWWGLIDADHWIGPGLQGAVRPGILLFPFGPPVLEPDFHLRFGQTQRQGQVQSFTYWQIPSRAELVLQSHQLLVREGRPGAPGLGTGLLGAPAFERCGIVRGDLWICTVVLPGEEGLRFYRRGDARLVSVQRLMSEDRGVFICFFPWKRKERSHSAPNHADGGKCNTFYDDVWNSQLKMRLYWTALERLLGRGAERTAPD